MLVIKLNQGVFQMTNNNKSEEYIMQILKECDEVGNVALVARRHNLAAPTVYAWRRKFAKEGSVKSLPRETTKRMNELENRIERTAQENMMLKKIVAEKELELAILREIRDLSNPK